MNLRAFFLKLLLSNSKFEFEIRIRNLKTSKSMESLAKHLAKCTVRFPDTAEEDPISIGVDVPFQIARIVAAAPAGRRGRRGESLRLWNH
jgi:hypothetical protein